MAGLLQRVEATEDVVAVDVGDAQLVAVAGDQVAGCGGQPARVEPSGVDDEADPVGDEVLERGVQVRAGTWRRSPWWDLWPGPCRG